MQYIHSGHFTAFLSHKINIPRQFYNNKIIKMQKCKNKDKNAKKKNLKKNFEKK